jgi:murein DD-endopeptidase MepM/ murein hydrolase activator NlpD
VAGIYQPGNEGPLNQAAMVERADQILARFRQQNPNVSVAPLLKAINDQLGLQIEIKGKSYAPDAGEEVLARARDAWGTDFDPAALRRDLAALRGQINPAKFGEVASKLESIIRSKDGKSATLASAEVNRAVESAKHAALAANYGADYKELQRAGSMNAKTERAANLAESVRRFNAAMYPAVNSAVAAAAAKKGGPLDPGETYEVASRAAADFAAKNQAAFNLLFPGGRVSGAPSLPGLNAMAPDPNAPKPSGKPAGPPAPPTFETKQLDSIPNRQQRLRNYQNESILSKEAVGRELTNAANGGGFSPQLRRAAMDALAPSPAEFLRVQGARYGINVPPDAMRRLNDQSSAITTPQRHLVAMASQGQSALGSFGRWAMDAATGARPASAAEWPSFGARSAAPGQFTISMRARGGGGGQDGGGPFMGSGGGDSGIGGQAMLVSPRGIKPDELGSGFGAHESFRRRPHEGQDARIPQGTPLGLAVGGTVIRVARTNSKASEANGGYGNFIDIQLTNGSVIRMAHLSRIPDGIRDGVPISPNQIVAYSGGAKGEVGSGRSTGPHLHFEVHVNGVPYDPMGWFGGNKAPVSCWNQ